MTILFLDQFSDPGGAQRCLMDLLPALRERGWQAHVAAPGEGALAEACRKAGCGYSQIHCGPFAMGRKSVRDMVRFAVQVPALRREIARLADAVGADLIYVNGPRLLPAVPAIRPIVFHCHIPLRKAYAVRLAAAAVRRTGATVIGCCGYVLDNLRPHVAAERLHVVYNGVAEAGPARREPGEGFTVGLIGRIAPEKGQAEFLEAARLLTGCRFIICGAPLFRRCSRKPLHGAPEGAGVRPARLSSWAGAKIPVRCWRGSTCWLFRPTVPKPPRAWRWKEPRRGCRWWPSAQAAFPRWSATARPASW